MNYRKILSAAIAGVMVFGLAACGQAEKNTESANRDQTALQQTETPKRGVTAFVGTSIF